MTTPTNLDAPQRPDSSGKRQDVEQQLNWINKRVILTASIIFLIAIIFTFFVLEKNAEQANNAQMYAADTREYLDERANTLFFEINGFPRGAGYDLLFLRGLSSLKEVMIAQNGVASDKVKKNLEQDFARFMNENKAYSQLRYIDRTGREAVKVTFNGTDYAAAPGSELQLVDAPLARQMAALDDGEIYISPLSLNNRSNSAQGIPNIGLPVMSYSVLVFDDKSERQGILVMTVDANYFLDDIRRAKREGETVFLINSKGYYLAHPDREKEFGLATGKNITIYDDYPREIADTLLHDTERRTVENDEYIFTYRDIYPTIGNSEVYKGSEKIYGKNSEKEYYWVLVTVSDKKSLNGAVEDLQRANIMTLTFAGGILLVIIILVLVLHSHGNRRNT